MITSITNEAAYNQALARLDEIFDAPTHTPEWEELRTLARLIEKYEEENMEDMDDSDA